MVQQHARAKEITRILSGELFKALGFSPYGWVASVFSPLVWKPIKQFSSIAVGFDEQVATQGFQNASRWILPNFVAHMHASGVDNIPREGPLLIVSNHPGAFDALVITAAVPRDDIKIIVNIPLPFIQELTATQEHFLYAPPDPYVRIGVVRAALRHLENGGALLIFASGGMDPDPASMKGAGLEINNWSESLGLFLRRVPQTQLQITMISGILSPKYVRHFFTRFRKERRDKQRISAFIQVFQHMLSPGEHLVTPQVSFANPITREDLCLSKQEGQIRDEIVRRARELFNIHTSLPPTMRIPWQPHHPLSPATD